MNLFKGKSIFFFNQNSIDAKCVRFASMIRIVFTKKKIINRTQRDFFENKKKKIIDDFRNYLFKNRIYYPNSGIIFLATSTSYKEINHLLETTKKAFKNLYK